MKPTKGKGTPMALTKKDIAIGLLLLLAAILCISLSAVFLQAAPPCAMCNAKVDIVLSPGAEAQVVSFIRSAQKTVDVEMYVFTSEDIVRELSDAEKRGVIVRVIMEPRVEDSRKQSIFDQLNSLGVETRWASFTYKLTHAKMIIADGKRALVGSINFSESALNSNREVAVAFEGEKVSELVGMFEEDWLKATAAGA